MTNYDNSSYVDERHSLLHVLIQSDTDLEMALDIAYLWPLHTDLESADRDGRIAPRLVFQFMWKFGRSYLSMTRSFTLYSFSRLMTTDAQNIRLESNTLWSKWGTIRMWLMTTIKTEGHEQCPWTALEVRPVPPVSMEYFKSWQGGSRKNCITDM